MQFNEVLSKIVQADDIEISEIIKAVIRRYEAAYPDWEIIFLSLPKHDPVERCQRIEEALKFLQ